MLWRKCNLTIFPLEVSTGTVTYLETQGLRIEYGIVPETIIVGLSSGTAV